MQRFIIGAAVVVAVAFSVWGASALTGQDGYNNSHSCHYVWAQVGYDGTHATPMAPRGMGEYLACPGSPAFDNESSR